MWHINRKYHDYKIHINYEKPHNSRIPYLRSKVCILECVTPTRVNEDVRRQAEYNVFQTGKSGTRSFKNIHTLKYVMYVWKEIHNFLNTSARTTHSWKKLTFTVFQYRQ